MISPLLRELSSPSSLPLYSGYPQHDSTPFRRRSVPSLDEMAGNTILAVLALMECKHRGHQTYESVPVWRMVLFPQEVSSH